MAKEPIENHKYAYKFGNTDRGILLSILIAGLFVAASLGVAAIGAVGSSLEHQEVTDGSSGSLATGVGVVVGLVLVSKCVEIVLILLVLTVVTYIIYRLLSWLEQKCRNLCACKWYKPWCCVGKLFCWAVTVFKWVALAVTVILAIATAVTLIWCFLISIAALF